MAESAEHAFLSDAILSIMEEFSTSRLYAYKEGERKRYDFSCDLVNNWKRVASGQTLWKHVEGIDKDIRILLSDSESDVLIYVARNTMKNKATLHEVVSDYKKTFLRKKLTRLRVFWVPENFDADKEEDRNLIYRDLKESVSRDLLLSVVLGGITRRDVQHFATWSGTVGATLAVLVELDRAKFSNYASLANSLNVGTSLIKDRILRLSLTDFITGTDNTITGKIHEVTPKGKVMLDLCGRLYQERHKRGSLDEGLRYICTLLGLEVERVALWDLTSKQVGKSGSVLPLFDPSPMLAHQIYAAVHNWGLSLPDPHYSISTGT